MHNQNLRKKVEGCMKQIIEIKADLWQFGYKLM